VPGEPVDPKTYRKKYEEHLEEGRRPLLARRRVARRRVRVAMLDRHPALASSSARRSSASRPTRASSTPTRAPTGTCSGTSPSSRSRRRASRRTSSCSRRSSSARCSSRRPFLSNKGERSARRRPWAIGIVVMTVVMIGSLWILGARSPWSPNFDAKPLTADVVGTTERDPSPRGAPLPRQGVPQLPPHRRHGGRRGPNLTHIGDLLTRDEITIRISNGGTNMPAFAGYGVNMKTSTPAIAADEASYAAADLASNLYGFEIGNEVDLYKSTLLSATWSYAIFDTQWRVFASAIRGGGPGAAAALTGPAAASNYEGYTVPFAADEASQIRLLTQHYYRANGMLATSTLDLLLKPDPGLVTMLEALSTAATKNAILDGYRCSECNSFYNGGASGVSDAFGTALWGIDFLFTNAEYGGSGVNFHGGGNGPGYTPIADANGAVVGVRPLYYGMLLFNLAGPGSMVEAQVDAAGLNFTAYAVGSTGGSTNIVLVNKDSTTTAHTTIHVGKTISMATVTRLEGPSLGATTGTTLGGAPVDVTGTWAPLPAASVSVSGDQAIVDVPPAAPERMGASRSSEWGGALGRRENPEYQTITPSTPEPEHPVAAQGGHPAERQGAPVRSGAPTEIRVAQTPERHVRSGATLEAALEEPREVAAYTRVAVAHRVARRRRGARSAVDVAVVRPVVHAGESLAIANCATVSASGA
jgi:hypothetical protein